MSCEQTFAKVLLLTPNAIVMEHSGFGEKVYRVVEILEDEVWVRDYGSGVQRYIVCKSFSNGYGKLYSYDWKEGDV